ncbi:GntR family transcriptional regulator [Aurantimonas sp. HBX-1]|uniref:GntR family transcriptional regulator n=1 Tax=Aurantimonas sp. HBX-1 TaxID=2906072 RepID=UPI001F482B89|nr:GntR family transcriptional regulator [Aurantimonas sp. HBX-1]UIJ73001.1 GntR family transcriptional regulator [Aurantimonas sp. HBX-1]
MARSIRPALANAFKPQTVGDQITASIRSAIVEGTLPPGEVLRQDELAARFGFSRMPIRDALRQLEAEGLVAIHPTKGAQVARLDAVELLEIFGMRVILEVGALRLSCSNLDAPRLEAAARLLSQMSRGADAASLCDLNRAFHATLYEPCGNARLLSQIDLYLRAADRYVRILLSAMDYQPQSHADHQAILDACCNGDAETAADALRQHLTHGSARLLSALDAQPVR